MKRLLPLQSDAIAFAQCFLGLKDDFAAALSGFSKDAIAQVRNKGGYVVGQNLPPDGLVDGLSAVYIRNDGSLVLETDRKGEAGPAIPAEESPIEASEEEQIEYMRQALNAYIMWALRRQSLDAPLKRWFDLIAAAIRASEILLKHSRQAEKISALPVNVENEMSETELAELLTKLDRRIDELAGLRLKELVAGEFRPARKDAEGGT